jgi:hypothetical protein
MTIVEFPVAGQMNILTVSLTATALTRMAHRIERTVNTPLSKRLRIDCLVSQTSGIVSAGLLTSKYDNCGVPSNWTDEYTYCVPDGDGPYPDGTCPDLTNPAPDFHAPGIHVSLTPATE